MTDSQDSALDDIAKEITVRAAEFIKTEIQLRGMEQHFKFTVDILIEEADPPEEGAPS